MKCQKCNKPATFHITEMTDDSPVELHLCEKHAKLYLHQNPGPVFQEAPESEVVPVVSLAETTQDLMELDFQSCPMCGISFQEFRKSGRLGCPNDYNAFRQQLMPLLLSIHGETEHVGKRPARFGRTDYRNVLIRLRRELDDAVSIEDYERASRLRDRIKQIDQP
ncbi:MAG: UvrB/UvrC motif-containing protein [Planctomycetia bacterium]|nr:UvrB/UvrC motif-containing protein [Planctomycetia bacterium]